MRRGRMMIVGAAVLGAELVGAQLPPRYEEAGGRERLVLATTREIVPLARTSPQPKAREWVQFAPGRSDAELTGELAAGETRDFHIVMRRHQTMAVALEAAGVPTRFSVLRRGAALFEAKAAVQHDWSGMLPATDYYVVRVSALDAPAQAGDVTRFQLRVAVIGRR